MIRYYKYITLCKARHRRCSDFKKILVSTSKHIRRCPHRILSQLVSREAILSACLRMLLAYWWYCCWPWGCRFLTQLCSTVCWAALLFYFQNLPFSSTPTWKGWCDISATSFLKTWIRDLKERMSRMGNWKDLQGYSSLQNRWRQDFRDSFHLIIVLNILDT